MEELQQITMDEYLGLKNEIKTHITTIVKSFVRIGETLCKIDQARAYELDGYKSVAEMAKAEYGMTAGGVSRFMGVYRKYCTAGQLNDGYENYSYAQLVEMMQLPEEDAELIKQAQRTAIMRDPTMAAATLVGAQADAMKTAAGNEAGAMTGFMGMGMATNAAGGGMNAQNLFAMGQQQQAQQAAQQQPAPQVSPAADGWKCACGTTVTGNFCPNCGAKKPEPKPAPGAWKCSCGATVTGNFCPECGSKRPEEDEGWTCSRGAVNKGKFCTNCGAKKPAGAPLYRCDKCGWEPEDPKNPPRFCPECGDVFDENDRQ